MAVEQITQGGVSIDEIFGPTIQGEGDLAGMPTVFVRTGGCDFRCVWCDTMHAVDPKYRDNWVRMSPSDIIARIMEFGYPGIIVTLSGGNPALQNGLEQVIDLGHAIDLEFTMETQASVFKPWMRKLDYLTLSPKPPSAKQDIKWMPLELCASLVGPQKSLKVVVFDDTDYEFAISMHQAFPSIPFYMSIGNSDVSPDHNPIPPLLERMTELFEQVAADPRARRISVGPQLHVLAWGNERGR